MAEATSQGSGSGLHPTEVFEQEIEALDRSTIRSWSSWLAGAGAFVVLAGTVLLVTSHATRTYRAPSVIGNLASVTLDEPAGAVDHLPAEFRWRETDGATSYLVTVLQADSDDVVLLRSTGRTTLAPSAQELAPFRPRGYRWTVEARGPDGRTLALGEGEFELVARAD